jgi:acyl-CoA thioester hydrolase
MRIEIAEQKKLTMEMRIPIAWGDMDAMGHVNNTVYFRYLETVRTEWMSSVGVTILPHGDGPVVVNAFCSFIRQLAFPGELLAKHYVANLGRSSFEALVTLERSDAPGVIHAAGGATTVWFDYTTQATVPVPDWLRALIS